MRAKHITQFQKWLKAMIALDNRLDARDFNMLFKLFIRSHDVSS